MESQELYFAFGSNMNMERMKERKAFFTGRVHAKLQGYRLGFHFNSGNGFGSANVVEDSTSEVHGALYTLKKGGLIILDKFEWVDRGGYNRHNVIVELDNGEMAECTTYICTEKYFKEGLIPSRTYLAHLLKGKDILPDDYYRHLESHKCGDLIKKTVSTN